jgi:hypothetical protein
MKDLIRRIIHEQTREMSPEMMTVYKLLERKIGYDNEFSTQYPLPYADQGNVYLKFNYGLNDRTKPKRDEDDNLRFITYIDVRNPIWKSDFDEDWQPIRDLREIDPILARLRQEIYKEIYRFLPEGSVKIQWRKVEDQKTEMGEQEVTERCWKGYTQKGMKTMFGKRYPNCVKKTK